MFGLGWSEMVLIGIVALIVIVLFPDLSLLLASRAR